MLKIKCPSCHSDCRSIFDKSARDEQMRCDKCGAVVVTRKSAYRIVSLCLLISALPPILLDISSFQKFMLVVLLLPVYLSISTYLVNKFGLVAETR